jgi:hypothetical protein
LVAPNPMFKKKIKKKKITKTKDFTEINKLLNGYKHFKMRKLISYYYFNKAKMPKSKKILQELLIP